MIHVMELELPGLLLIRPTIYDDNRGRFLELWHETGYRDAGILTRFVQDNVSRSQRGVVRGLHFQHPQGQAKLVTVLVGEVYDVVVDLRRGSPAFGQWLGVRLDAAAGEQLLIPDGFAHGFAALSDGAVFSYKCSAPYAPGAERTLLWNDADLGISWPVADPILSEKDAAGMAMADFASEDLPQYEAADVVV